MTERRPHLQRGCPFPDCDWIQVTSWFMGGPDITAAVAPGLLMAEAERHFLTRHMGKTPPVIIV